MQWELDWGVDLPSTLGLRGGEPLEVNHENLRRSRDDDLLGCHPFALAIGTLPDFVAAQHFLLTVAAETLVDVPGSRRRDLDADAVEGFVSGGCLPTCGAA